MSQASSAQQDKSAALNALKLNHNFNFHQHNAAVSMSNATFEAGDPGQWKYSPSSESKLEALENAARKAGVYAPAVKVIMPPNKPRGLFATAHIKKNETFLKIPLTAMMEIEPQISRFNFTAGQYKGRLIDNIMLSKPDQTLVDLYIDTLPSDFSESLFYFNSIFFQTSNFGKRVALNLQWFKNLYLHQKSTAGISLDELLWTALIVCSRQFTFNGKHYLVPIADLLNHCEARHNCRFYFNKSDNAMHFVALRKIKAGEELIHLYEEEMTSASALLGYGMMPSRKVCRQRPNIHYVFNRKLYHLNQNMGLSLVPVVLDLYFQQKSLKPEFKLEDAYQLIHKDLQQQIYSRNTDKNRAVNAASSDWEKKVLDFIYEQESSGYSNMSNILGYLASPQMKLKPAHSTLKYEIIQFKQALTKYLR